MIGLTPKQRQLYDFIAAEIVVKGVCASIREMMAAMGLKSKSNIGRCCAF
jgi:SOS-response transcriptional repressor LexA